MCMLLTFGHKKIRIDIPDIRSNNNNKKLCIYLLDYQGYFWGWIFSFYNFFWNFKDFPSRTLFFKYFRCDEKKTHKIWLSRMFSINSNTVCARESWDKIKFKCERKRKKSSKNFRRRQKGQLLPIYIGHKYKLNRIVHSLWILPLAKRP